jgi:septal ring factor EnvC (AmiA/AmiB activator)
MDYLDYIVSGIIATVFSAMAWLVRTVLTNQKQLQLLEREIKAREERRDEDRQAMQEIRNDIKEIKRDILDLYKNDK